MRELDRALRRIRELLEELLSLEYESNFFTLAADVTRRKTNLPKTFNVREVFTSLLKQNNSSLEPKSTLEKTHFVDNVRSCVLGFVGLLVFCGHDDESEAGLIKHGFEPFLCRQAGGCFPIELVPWQVQAILKEVLQVLPNS